MNKKENLTFNIKAESLASYLLESSEWETVSIAPVIAHHQGSFEDIKEIQIEGKTTTISVNRTGLFGHLPSNLFTKLSEEPIPDSAKAAEIDQQIKDAKLFFQPFDKTLAQSRIELEGWEKNAPSSIFEQIIAVDEDKYLLNDSQEKSLVYMMPHLDTIVGNLKLTAQCFEILTGDTIKIEPIYGDKIEIPNGKLRGLGSIRLGKDSVIDNWSTSDIAALSIEVSPTPTENLQKYLPIDEAEENQAIGIKLLKFLAEIFIPIENNVIFYIDKNTIQAETRLNQENQPIINNRLGFTTLLH